MTIQDIRYIMMIAQEGSINRAAQKLYIPQPSLSKCLKRVEDEYAVTLFQRRPGMALVPTEAGAAFLEMCTEVLREHRRFLDRVQAVQQSGRKRIVLGLPPRHAHALSDRLIQWMYDQYPQYLLEIHTGATAGLEDALYTGEVNAAVLGVMEQQDGLYYEKLFASHLCVYLRPNSPVAKQAVRTEQYGWPVLRIEDLKQEPMAVNQVGSSSRRQLDQFAQRGGVQLNLLEVPDWTNRRLMAENGIASTTTSLQEMRFFASRLIRRDMVYLLDPQQGPVCLMTLACRNDFKRDPRFRVLLEGVREIMTFEMGNE